MEEIACDGVGAQGFAVGGVFEVGDCDAKVGAVVEPFLARLFERDFGFLPVLE